MIYALIGSLFLTLTLVPVLCAWFMRRGVRERRSPLYEACKLAYVKGLNFWSGSAPGARPSFQQSLLLARCC